MLLPCEVGIKTVLPAVKAIMARVMMEKHGMKEKQTADLLGLSQSAVSRYMSRERGNLIEIETTAEIVQLIEHMVTFVIKEPDNKNGIMSLFCQTCQAIRQKGLMCSLCKKDMSEGWAEKCTFCGLP